MAQGGGVFEICDQRHRPDAPYRDTAEGRVPSNIQQHIGTYLDIQQLPNLGHGKAQESPLQMI